jgi:pimeloyl-ACP methyl ester carboxylesterase
MASKRVILLFLVFLTGLLSSCYHPPVFLYSDIEVGEPFYFMSGKTRLRGDIIYTSRPVKGTILCLIGSGETSYRNSWSTQYPPLWKTLSQELNAKGYHVALIEKRGVNGSGGSWRKANIFERALDGLAAINYLKNVHKLPMGRVGLLGHSQGAYVSLEMAVIAPNEIDFLIQLTGPVTSVREQILDDHESQWYCQGLDESEIDSRMIKLEKKLDRYAHASFYFKFHHLSRIIHYDPIGAFAVLEKPALFVFAENDNLVPAFKNRDLLREVLPKEVEGLFTSTVIPDANHNFTFSSFCIEKGSLNTQLAPGLMMSIRRWEEL